MSPGVLRKKNSEGFSLVELVIVVAVIAILAAIAIPAYINYVSGSKRQTTNNILEQFPLLIETYRAENGFMCPACNANGTYTYAYTEDNNGVENTVGNKINTIYPDFTPKKATATGPILYHFTLQIQVTNCAASCDEVATFTATPQVARGAPSGNLTGTHQ